MKRQYILYIILFFSIGCWGQYPWSVNVSRPNKITNGMAGRHISLWASHGRYYSQERGCWRWQRTRLFGTCEDIFTQTVVVPFLIPMLENAGCYVFTPRERDWQKNELIIDNDLRDKAGDLQLFPEKSKYDLTVGFCHRQKIYRDGENPFLSGTALSFPSCQDSQHSTHIKYTPHITEPGRYAVYVSYPYLEDACPDVCYTVYHSGISTEFHINQRMGFGTWVYLGSFFFSNNRENPDLDCVVVSTHSSQKGHVGTDAVRLGGGMGNILRGDSISGFARCLEGSRYYAQWAGAPYTVYSSKNGVNDYGDDINARSLMTNWLNRGSQYNPADSDSIPVHRVPLEMTLAVHSDAGYCHDGKTVYGSLAICTTDFNNGKLADGNSRALSKDFADKLLVNLTEDLNRCFGGWARRDLLDRNYSETRIPTVPSAIIETLSHQSFPDMRIAQHPVAKFEIARSLYKTILRYSSHLHGTGFTVEPLPTSDFQISLESGSTVRLSWQPVFDKTEPTASPTSYNIYTAVGDQDFDNGQNIKSTSCLMTLHPGVRYRFRITQCNAGGESLPSPVLSAYISTHPDAPRIMVIDGFERLSTPFIIDNDSLQGFDLHKDEGVQYGVYPGWAGYQDVFTKSTMGSERSNGLGHTGYELQGKFLAGNGLNTAAQHVEAISQLDDYTALSATLQAFQKSRVSLDSCQLVDFAFGLQKDDGQLGLHYKTFTHETEKLIRRYTARGGSLLVSGSFIGSDMKSTEDSLFAANVLKYIYIPADSSYTVDGRIKTANNSFNIQHYSFNFWSSLNESHYPCTHPEQITPINGSSRILSYSDGTAAGTAYSGYYKSVCVGFPLECIIKSENKNKIFSNLLKYLLPK